MSLVQPSPVATPVEAASVYATAILDGLGGTGWALDINAGGDIVGYVTEPDSEVRLPALWRNGALELLETPDNLGGVATAINDAGIIAGYLQMPDGDTRPVVWWDGVPSVLDTPAGVGYAYAVNNPGQVVGEFQDASGGWQPALWDDGRLTILDTGEAGRGQARAINDAGQIAGTVGEVEDGSQAVVWTDGRLEIIGSPGSSARDISSSGVVVGSVPDPSGTFGADGEVASRAVTWADGEAAWIDAGEDVTETLGMAMDDRAGIAISAREGEGPPRAVAVTPAGPVTLEKIGNVSRPEAINGDGIVVGSALFGVAGAQPVHWVPVGPLVGLPAANDVAGPWAVMVLPSLGGDAQVKDINAGGTIVGYVEHASSGVDRPAMWRDGELTVLDTLGGRGGEALGVNDSGTVVGSAENGTGQMRPVRWDGTGVTDLGTVGGPEGAAIAINTSGQIAGWAETVKGDRHAVLWDAGSIVDLGTIGDDGSAAIDITDAGEILIVSGSFVPEHAALWEGGAMRPFEPGTGDFVFATAINNRGDVVGVYATGDGDMQGFVVQGDVLSDMVAPANQLWAPMALSDEGMVAGVVAPSDDGGWSTAAIWRDGVELRLMPQAVGLFSTAMAVNDRNIVAGLVQLGGDEHAVVWIPVAALLPDGG